MRVYLDICDVFCGLCVLCCMLKVFLGSVRVILSSGLWGCRMLIG